MFNTLHLILPGLFCDKNEMPSVKDKLTHIDKALIKATSIDGKPSFLESVLKSHFSGLKSGELPAGALGALIYGLHDLGSDQVWMRADPVSLKVDAHTVYCLGNHHINLTEEECQAIEKSFNEHFSDRHLLLNAVSPKEWYLRLEKKPEIATNALADVEGKSIHEKLPTGPHQDEWLSCFTEIQMLFHNHPVNLARQKEGKPTVDALWFWGLGTLPAQLVTHFDLISANSHPIQGMAKCANLSYIPLAPTYENLADYAIRHQSSAIAVLDTRLKRANNLGNESLRHHLLMQYDKNWFEPLLEAIQEGQLKELYIDACDGVRYFITRRHLKYFWRRNKVHVTL